MTPNTTVTLYATDFDITNKHVVYADSEGAALAAVSSFPSVVFTNCYWQRTDGFVFRCNGNINEIERYNYCIFENDGKRNYAFITKCQYVNDAMTWVYLEIDPWLNFAGQYDFNPSPMRRCHPRYDGLQTTMLNYLPEPYQVAAWNTEEKSEGLATEDALLIHLVTAVKTTSYSLSGIDNYFDGMLSLAKGESVTLLKSWAGQIQAGTTTIGATGMQPNTSVVSPAIAGQIIQAFVQNGRQQDIIGMYHIPIYFTGAVAAGEDLAGIPNTRRDLTFAMNWDGNKGAIHWNKVLYSPQFNKLYENLCGNTRMIPVDLYAAATFAAGNLQFEVFATQGINGNAILAPMGLPGDAGHGYYSIASPTWDRVQLSTYGVDLKALQSNILSTTQTAVTGAANIASDIVNPFNVLNPGGAVLNTATDIINTTTALKQNEIQAQAIIQDGAEVVGTNSSTIAAYNESNPLVKLMHYFPSLYDILKLERFFGTFGYNQGGFTCPIVFNNYPYFNYYETVSANISGRGVPQKYINAVIAMFNRGVHVYNNIGVYKNLDNAINNHL